MEWRKNMKITKILCDICLEEREVKPIACPVLIRSFDLHKKACVMTVKSTNIEVCSSCLEKLAVLRRDEGSERFVFMHDTKAALPEVIAREHEA